MENTNSRTLESIEPNVWKPEKPGDFIEGVLIQKREDVGTNKSHAYYLESDGKQTMVWGSTILDGRMDFVNVGEFCRITFKEKTTNSKGQPLNVYKVEREKRA